MIPVFYSEKMLAHDDASPSAGKPRLVADALKKQGHDIEFYAPEAVTIDDLCLAHSESFVRMILSRQLANGFGTHTVAVANSLPYTSGAMLGAARAAIARKGPAAALCSGFHHACYASAGGFCTFNGLMVTALKLLYGGDCKRIAIIDADQHYGNGTDDIIRRLKPVGIKHLTFGQYFHSPNDASNYLSKMREACLGLRRRPPDLVLYQAGADSHRDDPLGGVLTTEEMYARDLMIFEACSTANIPIAWNLAGGYQEVEKIVTLHMNTFRAAAAAYEAHA